MKKQIFILVMALFAVTSAFGQIDNIRPLTASCAPAAGPLNPYVGTLYNYTVDVPTSATWTGVTYHWFVTDQTTFITGSNLTTDRVASGILTSTAVYDAPANTVNTIPITWTSAAASAAIPYYLVVYVEGTDGTCTDVNNIKVYEINPVQSFLIEIANVDATGTIYDTWDATTKRTPDLEVCRSPVKEANYDGTKMIYDYGTNYLYFAVSAANFGTEWDATFHLDGLVAGQTIGAVEWTRNSDLTTGLAAVTATTAHVVGTPGVYTLNVPAVDLTTTEAGETIYIRVTVENGTYEGLVDNTFTLAVDGLDADGNGDLHFDDCTVDNFANDIADQIIKPRPNVDNTDATDVIDPGFLQP